jgi:hypothetical protein
MAFSVNDEIFYDQAVTKQPIIFIHPQILLNMQPLVHLKAPETERLSSASGTTTP